MPKKNIEINTSRQRSPSAMHSWPLRLLICLSIVVALVTTGCSSAKLADEDENGTIGTGIRLEGTVSHTLLAMGTVIDAVSSDGKSSEIPIDSQQQFSTSSLAGTAPWMLRVRVSADRELFGIAYGDGTRNINAFSDVSLRRWFAQQSLRVDENFDSPDSLVQVPTQSEYDASVASVVQLIELVLASYDITGTDIISTKYETDNSGIDKFLKQNTVILENDLFTFQVTNPTTGIRAETKSTIELASNSVDNGSPPSVPGSLRALSGGMDDIVLIWEPSTDDTGVAGYEVYRNQLLLGTTPYPQFIDTNLDSNQTYTYTIVAIDTANNPSASSLPVEGMATPSGNSTAPAPPTMLKKLSATSTTIRLSWNASTSPDVVRYNVYRGVEDTTETIFTPLQSVSVSRATDTAVAINATYCYQVEAVNAVGEESSLSETLCVKASNASSNAGGPDGSIGTPNDKWKVPKDLNVLDCSTVLNNDAISPGLNAITEGCFSVPQTLTVTDGATLKLGEGVILRFGVSAKLYVEQNAALTVLGTLNKPVVLTGEKDVPGSWAGVHFAGTTSADNLLRGAVIQYAGSESESGRAIPAISAVASGLFRGPHVRIEDTLVQHNKGSALLLNVAETSIDSFKNNLIYDNQSIGAVVASTLQTFDKTSQFIDNTINHLTVNPSLFRGTDIVIPNLGITIRWGGITIEDGSLIIQPGVDLEIEGGWKVDVDGPVTMVGDADRPITLRGRYTDAQGTWKGLRLHGSGVKLLDHVQISYGGADEAETGAIEIDCTGKNNFRVQVDNTKIDDSASWGIFQKGSNCETAIGNTVTYWNNARGDSNIQ